MRKLIMFITMLLSLIAMVGVTLAAEEIIQSFGLIDLSNLFSSGFDVIVNAFESSFNAGLALLDVIAWGIIQAYGIPLIFFS